MRFVIQRCSSASVRVDGTVTGEIGKGFAVLIGISHDDDEHVADRLIKKMLGLRIFQDDNGKTNVSLRDSLGSLLLISQFTLYADCRKGNRPSFINAGDPEKASGLYDYITAKCREELDRWNLEYQAAHPGSISGDVYTVATGIFGADMEVSLTNEGPFTIILDSDELKSAGSGRKGD